MHSFLNSKTNLKRLHLPYTSLGTREPAGLQRATSSNMTLTGSSNSLSSTLSLVLNSGILKFHPITFYSMFITILPMISF